MLALKTQTRPVPACNDNAGLATARRPAAAPRNILKVAMEVSGAVQARYIADVLVITSR